MYWQNPLLVREVKTQLKNAMMSAGVTAASGVVDALIGTLVGSVLSKTNNRDYINFVGEIAGRSLTSTQRKVMSRAYVASRSDSHIDKEGRITASLPNRRNPDGRYLDQSGNVISKSYQSVSGPSVVDSQMKFGEDNYYKTWGNKDNNNNNNNRRKKNDSKPKNHSELSIAVSELCSSPRDFSIMDFFRNIKEKLFPKLDTVPKEEAAKAVLEGSFEFLEENGYDGYSVLVNILNSHMGESRNFSEESFGAALSLWRLLSPEQKDSFYSALQVACGTGPAKSYIGTLQTSSESGQSPSIFRMTFLKALGVLGIAYGILSFISSPASRGVKRPTI